MNGYELIEIFMKTTDELMAHQRLYVLTNQERFINFRATDFKKKLQEVVFEKTGKKKIKSHMDGFKTLQFIISEDDRYTNVQKINGRSIRVLSVDRIKLDYLKTLTWEDVQQKKRK